VPAVPELVSTYSYAKRKTARATNIALAALAGSAILNNTLVLSIFLLLVAVNRLEWEFGSETFGLLFCVYAVAAIILMRDVHTLADGVLILLLYPTSLLLVVLIRSAGMDQDRVVD